jgi:hypothetical protein
MHGLTTADCWRWTIEIVERRGMSSEFVLVDVVKNEPDVASDNR